MATNVWNVLRMCKNPDLQTQLFDLKNENKKKYLGQVQSRVYYSKTFYFIKFYYNFEESKALVKTRLETLES